MAKRHISSDDKTIQVEFSNGETFEFLQMTSSNNELTRMIEVLESRLAKVEEEMKAQLSTRTTG
jgi:hypothetical protein